MSHDDFHRGNLCRGLIVRPLATDTEVDACAAMMAEAPAWIVLGRDFAACRRACTDETRERYVAYQGGALAGLLILNLRGAFTGYLQTLCVAEDFRGRGIGTALIAFAEETVFARTANVFLCVSASNPGARRLYERLGYTLVGTLTDYLVAGQDELLFRKSRGPLV